jgi:hypothetical protein
MSGEKEDTRAVAMRSLDPFGSGFLENSEYSICDLDSSLRDSLGREFRSAVCMLLMALVHTGHPA